MTLSFLVAQLILAYRPDILDPESVSQGREGEKVEASRCTTETTTMLFLPRNRGPQNFRVIKISLLFIAMFHRCRRGSRGRREMTSIDGIVILYYIKQLFF